MLDTLERNATAAPVAQQPKLLDRMRQAIRVKHYSLATERTYVHWAKRFIYFHQKRHPAEMGAAEVEAFLSALATELAVSASTQNQAMHALLFLYRDVLAIIRDLLGHANLAVTSRYTHLMTGDLKRASEDVARLRGKNGAKNPENTHG